MLSMEPNRVSPEEEHRIYMQIAERIGSTAGRVGGPESPDREEAGFALDVLAPPVPQPRIDWRARGQAAGQELARIAAEASEAFTAGRLSGPMYNAHERAILAHVAVMRADDTPYAQSFVAAWGAAER